MLVLNTRPKNCKLKSFCKTLNRPNQHTYRSDENQVSHQNNCKIHCLMSLANLMEFAQILHIGEQNKPQFYF